MESVGESQLTQVQIMSLSWNKAAAAFDIVYMYVT